MNSKIHYDTRKQKESKRVKPDPFTNMAKDHNNDFEKMYTKSENTDKFEVVKLKKDISLLRKKLKKHKISFRDLLTCAPKNKDSIFMCIKAAKGIVENPWLFEEIRRKKTLPIQDVLNVANVYRGTLKKNSKYIIALCVIISSGLESLNIYINNTYAKKEHDSNLGIILELSQKGAIVMSNDCTFLLIRKRKGMFLGKQIKFANWEIKKYNQKIVKKVVTGIALTGVTAVLLAAFYYEKKPAVHDVYAIVDIDINPSLGLLIDRNNSVVDVNTINRDADILLMDNDLRGMMVDQAIEMVFEFAHDRGFVYEDKENLVLVSLALNPEANKNGDEEKYFEQLLNQIKSGVKGDEVIIPIVIAVPQDTVKTAGINNLSIGRQYIYESLQGFDLGEIRRSSIEDLLIEGEFTAGRY